MKKAHVVIVGAGAAGLSAACHLAGAGWRVTVIEKNEHAGGRCDRLVRDGHHFDVGPTLLVMRGLYELEFAALGQSLRDMLSLRRVDPTYELQFDDGSSLALTSDPARLRTQLEAIEPGSYEASQRYLAEGSRYLHLVVEQLVRRRFGTLREFLRPGNLPLFLGVGALQNHYRHMGSFFRSPRLKAAFSFQDMYVGLSPFEAPSTYSMMQYSELAEGVWFPQGGMIRVAEALESLARSRGVEFRFRSPVEQIAVDGSKAHGVLLADGSRVEADVVLANADLPYVYSKLLPPDGTAERLRRRRYSCSAISFLWGVDRVYPQLPAHTLFLTDEYRRNFEAITRDHGLAQEPTVYVHAPTRLDASMAPPGQDTLIAIVPVGHLDPHVGQDWEAMTRRARRAVLERLARLGVTDLEAHLKFEIGIGPADWQRRYNLVHGATHGLAHTLTQMVYFRPHNRHAQYRNLYFAGASTHPGTGLPTVVASGRLAAERILEDHPTPA